MPTFKNEILDPGHFDTVIPASSHCYFGNTGRCLSLEYCHFYAGFYALDFIRTVYSKPVVERLIQIWILARNISSFQHSMGKKYS